MSIAEATLRPAFRTLTGSQVDEVLRRNHLGRIAYSWRSTVDVEPLHYVYRDGWIYARTSEGEKYRVLAQSYYRIWPVAFEVDEAEGFFRWRSVVVHGSAYLLTPPEEGGDPEQWEEAVTALRTLLPGTFTPEDPVPFRNAIFRIAVQEASGREAAPDL